MIKSIYCTILPCCHASHFTLWISSSEMAIVSQHLKYEIMEIHLCCQKHPVSGIVSFKNLCNKIALKQHKIHLLLRITIREVVKKNGYFKFGLTVRVDPPSPFRAFFVCAFFISDYDFMCSESDFTQEKVILIQPLESSIYPYCLLLLCHKMVG